MLIFKFILILTIKKHAHTHFADFKQVIIKISHFATLNKNKTLGRNRIPWHFFLRPLPFLHPSFLDLLGSPPTLSSTPTLGFFECRNIFAVLIPTEILWHILKCILSLKYCIWFVIFAVSIPTEVLWHILKCILSLKYCIWFAIFAVSIPSKVLWYIFILISKGLMYLFPPKSIILFVSLLFY